MGESSFNARDVLALECNSSRIKVVDTSRSTTHPPTADIRNSTLCQQPTCCEDSNTGEVACLAGPITQRCVGLTMANIDLLP